MSMNALAGAARNLAHDSAHIARTRAQIDGYNKNLAVDEPKVSSKSKLRGPLEKMGPGHLEQLKAGKIGKPLPPDALAKFMDKVRKFDSESPIASKVVAVGSILAVSATVGYLLNLLVDELAHLTERKNDKVGMLVGTIVGLLMSASHLGQLFAVSRRLEMHMKARDWWEDGMLPESQAKKLIEDNFLPFKHVLVRNAQANLGVSVKDLRVQDYHMVDTLNDIIKNNIPLSKWRTYMTEYDEEPRFNQPMVRATYDHKHLGITAGKYYVSKFDRADQILERDLQNAYDPDQVRANGVLADLRKYVTSVPGVAGKATSDKWRKEIINHAPPSVREVLLTEDGQLEPIAEQVRVFFARHKETHEIPSYDNKNAAAQPNASSTPTAQPIDTHSTESPPQNEKGSEKINGPASNIAPGEMYENNYGRDDNFAENVDAKLHTDLVAFIRTSKSGPNYAGRTYIRIDELTKVGLLLSSMRPPTVHTMLRNYMDSFVEGVSSGSNPSIQARNAGSAFPGYVPMLGIGSVVTVLGLGLSSSSPPPGVATESAQKPSKTAAINNSNGAQNQGNQNTSAGSAGTYPAPSSSVIGSAYLV